MSIRGGVHRALERGGSIACDAVQIFTRNQLRWTAPPLRAEEIRRFHELKGTFKRVLAHASYLINLASPEERIQERSIAALTEELQRCRVLGIPELILHPGAHRGSGIERGIERLVEGLHKVYADQAGDSVRLTLEISAGGGSTLGGSFEQLRDLLGALDVVGVPVGICLDTQRFDRLIGREHLVALHLNDSRGALGSARDRHEHIGSGRIGRSGFKLLAGDPRLAAIPGILETPKGADMHEDVENLAVLKSLASR